MRNYNSMAQRTSGQPHFVMWVGSLLCVVVLCALMMFGQFNLLFAITISSILVLASLRDKSTAILLTFAYLFLMGDLRRILSLAIGRPERDLLLLIAPTVALALVLPRLARLRFRSGLSKAMLFLLILMILEMFNPKQGGLLIGLSGAVFYIAPVLWFWVGQCFGSPLVIEKLLYRVIFPLAVLAAILGFAQSFIGFLPYEQAWIDVAVKSYKALHLGASIRPFGFSVSAAEYVTLLILGAVGAAAAFFGSKPRWVIIVPVLIVSIVLASERTAVLRMIFALALVWVFRKDHMLSATRVLSIGLLVTAGLLSVVLLATFFSKPQVSSRKSSAVDEAMTHQVGGLAHPLDSRYSTAGIHRDMFFSGVLQGFTNPIGFGLGRTTELGRVEGDHNTGSSEVDISDMFISLGLGGGLLYLYIVVYAMVRAVHALETIDRSISLPLIAMLSATLGAWLIGGQYSMSALTFFFIGALTYNQYPQSEEMPAYNRAQPLVAELT